jgi:hypothetical protein
MLKDAFIQKQETPAFLSNFLYELAKQDCQNELISKEGQWSGIYTSPVCSLVYGDFTSNVE